MSVFWIGTSGYANKEWKGSFYPGDVGEQDLLRCYAGQFTTVELNYTFYRMPNVRTVQGWAKDTPDPFAFALKAPRRITHDLRLRDAGDALTYFCDTAKALRGKLGPLLFQVPQFLRKDLSRLEDFLHQVPPGFRVAFEFRSPTWLADDVFECLQRFDAALCVVDHEERAVPLVETATFGYLRLRRPAYAEADLALWAQRLADAARWEHAFVYFKQEGTANAPLFALRLAGLLTPAPGVAACEPQ
jgi:uncharacterized protein YecE (DUF72 family)